MNESLNDSSVLSRSVVRKKKKKKKKIGKLNSSVLVAPAPASQDPLTKSGMAGKPPLLKNRNFPPKSHLSVIEEET